MFLTDPAYGWQFSENECVAKGGHLVSIHSSDENDFLVGQIGRTNRGIYWVGLRVSNQTCWFGNSFFNCRKCFAAIASCIFFSIEVYES